MSCNVESLIKECKRLEEDSLYTAQAHFQLAERYEWRLRLLVVIPAILAAIFAFIATIRPQECGFLGYIATFLGAAAAASASLGMEKAVSSHRQAANLMTAMRHQVRRLYEVFSSELTAEEFMTEFKRLCERYDSYVVALEVTDKQAFEEARVRIQAGTFKSD